MGTRIIWAIIGIVWWFPGSSPAQDDNPLEILKRATAATTANLSAAKSVNIVGIARTEGKVAKTGSEAMEEELRRRLQPQPSGRFRFLADDFGKIKRYDLRYDDEKTNSLFHASQSACDGDKVFEVTFGGQGGYVRPKDDRTFQGKVAGIYDFFARHAVTELKGWATDLQRENLRVREVGDVLEIDLCTIGQKGEQDPTGCVLGIDKTTYLFRRLAYEKVNRETRVEWKRDAGSQVWYPSLIRIQAEEVYPHSKTVFRQVDIVEVQQATINEPIAQTEFTFEGLGLREGALVTDMRVTPEVTYVYKPDNKTAAAGVVGLAPLSSGTPVEDTSAGPKWRIILASSMILLLGILCGLGFRRFRQRPLSA